MSWSILCRDLTLCYGQHTAVENLDAEIESGTLTALIGPNGAGKSTLLEAVVGNCVPAHGQIVVCEQSRGAIAYLPQHSRIAGDLPIHVAGLVSMGLWTRRGAWGRRRRQDREDVRRAIEALGLTGLAQRPIGALSGGEYQRALFARILVQDACLILLDEPFAAVDEQTALLLQEVILRWHSEGRTVVTVLHDLYLVRTLFPRTLWLDRRKMAHDRTPVVLDEVQAWQASRGNRRNGHVQSVRSGRVC
jgi:zinc/manganese transport system ATP-binding protein